MKKWIFISCLLLISAITIYAQQNDFPKLTGPYLGQKPQGDVPEIFAPGVVADIGSEHCATKFTPDGKEVFWSRIMNPGQSPRCMVIMHMKQVNGMWGKPELAPFNIGINNFIESISPDGKRLYFIGLQIIEKGEDSTRRYATWVVNR